MRLVKQNREKVRLVRADSKSRQTGLGALVVFQHILLWCALYITVSTAYLLASAAITTDILPASVLLVVSGAISLAYIGLHNAAATVTTQSPTDNRLKTKAILQWLAVHTIKLAALTWLPACGLVIIFTVAEEPYCLPHDNSTTLAAVAIDTGGTCILQRTAVGASLLAMLTTSVLFVLVHKTSDPFRAHLLGITKESTLLPLALPYKQSTEHALFSEMSFKCRSSTSLWSQTLVPSRSTSTTQLLPALPEKAIVGLGIYAPKQQAPSFLTPRPSLCSIRTHITIGWMPPSSPLPPLPAYFPDKHGKPSAMQKAVHPPRGPYSLSRSQSEKTVRIVPPSPSLSTVNLAAFNRSTESLSSVYSRSISGESRSTRPGALSEADRSYSSGSTATRVKSPLGVMRRADEPDTIVMPDEQCRVSSDGSDSDIDDAATLQAKLPSVKAVSEFGEVETWQVRRPAPLSVCEHPKETDRKGNWKAMDVPPLKIRRTRDRAAL